MKSNYPILEFTLLGISLLFLGYALTSMLDSPLQENGMLGEVNLSVIQDTTLLPFSPPPQRFQSLGTLIDKIIFCESSGNERAYNPESGAKGLCQVIPSSERFCEQGLNRELDMFNREDNLDCADYLLEHGGLKHWQESKNCWQ